MLARVVRVIDYGERQHVVLEGDEGRRYHLTVQAIKDFNNHVVGHKAWLRRDAPAYSSRDAAIDAALEDIERLEGRQLPDVSALDLPAPAASQGRPTVAQAQPAPKSPHATP